MLADWFNQPADQAVNRVEEFEREVKKKFIHEPGQMKLLIVVDKLLTGRLKLDDINHGFDLLHEGKAIRQVVVFE